MKRDLNSFHNVGKSMMNNHEKGCIKFVPIFKKQQKQNPV